MNRRIVASLALATLLSACGGSRPASIPRTPASPQAGHPIAPPPEAQVLRAPGLDGVIGATGAALLGQFGQPRLDVREGDARKLQFSGTACVLDIYLYPPRGGGEPAATYVDARRASDGQEVDRAACVSALRQR